MRWWKNILNWSSNFVDWETVENESLIDNKLKSERWRVGWFIHTQINKKCTCLCGMMIFEHNNNKKCKKKNCSWIGVFWVWCVVMLRYASVQPRSSPSSSTSRLITVCFKMNRIRSCNKNTRPVINVPGITEDYRRLQDSWEESGFLLKTTLPQPTSLQRTIIRPGPMVSSIQRFHSSNLFPYSCLPPKVHHFTRLLWRVQRSEHCSGINTKLWSFELETTSMVCFEEMKSWLDTALAYNWWCKGLSGLPVPSADCSISDHANWQSGRTLKYILQ